MPKTLRFQDLVAKAGHPQTVTLWTDPGSDPSFSRAIKENRVLTLIQPRTSNHKDYGVIGFHKDPHASYLVFPRSLPEDGDRRVIAIKYELLDMKPVGKVVQPKPPKSEKPKPSPADMSKAPVEQSKPPHVENPKLSIVEKPKPPVEKEKPKLPPVQPPPPAQPVQKKFTVRIRRTANLESSITVQARNTKEAKEQALESVRKTRFDSSEPGVREKLAITRVEEKD